MCDYSLEMYASRPAREGEKYVTTRFTSGSVGLASAGDCGTAVCVQYDTRLFLENVPAHIQAGHPGERAEVVFCRLDHGAYHDAIRFADGKAVSLQQLGPGVTVWVKALLERMGEIVADKEHALVD
jgi:hypothetical protein